jgi:lipopolysaccharide exporter
MWFANATASAKSIGFICVFWSGNCLFRCVCYGYACLNPDNPQYLPPKKVAHLQLFKRFKGSFWLRSFLLSSMQRFSLVFFGALSFFILARFFTTEQMGYWSLYTIIISNIELVKQGLLRNATIKYLHTKEYSVKQDEVQSVALVLNSVFSLIVILIFATCTLLITKLLNAPPLMNMLYLSIIMMLVLIPFSHCEMILQAHFQFQHNFVASLLRQGIFLAFIIGGRFFFPSHVTFTNMVLVQIGAIVLGTIYYLWVVRPFLLKKFSWRQELASKLLNFGRYVCGTALFGSISRSVDQLITANVITQSMGQAIGMTYVSYYNAVSRVNNFIDMPSYAAAEILFPKFAQVGDLEGPERIKYYFERMVATLIAIIMPLNLIILFLPQLVLQGVAGKKYIAAALILQISATYAFLRPFINNFGHTLDSLGKPKLNFRVNFFLSIFNTAVTYLFLKAFGYIGAAYSSLLLNFATAAIFYAILKKELKIDLKNILVYTRMTYIQFYQQFMKIIGKPVVENPA